MPAKPQPQAQTAVAHHHGVQTRQQNAEGEAGQMREGRVFERLQPGAVTPPVGVGNAVRIEDHVERAGKHSQQPHAAQFRQMRRNSFRPLPARHPGKDHVVKRLGRHRPGGRVHEGGDGRNPSLHQERRQGDAGPEHCVRVRPILDRQHPPGQHQTEKIDGINAREAGLPEPLPVQLPGARPFRVVIGQHKSRQQDEVAHREVAGVDHRRKPAKPFWIGKMEQHNVDGRKTAQTRQCIQPSWLAYFHWVLDVSGQSLGTAVQNQSPVRLWFPVPCFYAVTSDPTFSPRTTRRMFPG